MTEVDKKSPNHRDAHFKRKVELFREKLDLINNVNQNKEKKLKLKQRRRLLKNRILIAFS